MRPTQRDRLKRSAQNALPARHTHVCSLLLAKPVCYSRFAPLFPLASRTNTCFALSFGDRSLGDLVSCVPHVARVQAGEGEYIIMGSDGLWDVVGNDDACGLVGEGRERGGDWQDAAERLTREAYARGSKDNIGVSIVKLTEKESDDGEELRKLLEGGAGKATRKMKKLGSVIEQH